MRPSLKKIKISAEEIKVQMDWLENNPSSVPESVHSFLLNALTVLLKFLEPTKDLKMRRFLELMGLVPKSEKGSSLPNQ